MIPVGIDLGGRYHAIYHAIYLPPVCAGERFLELEGLSGLLQSPDLDERHALRSEEVLALVFRDLKRTVEDRLEEFVNEVEITVPAYFDIKAKEMAMKSAAIADFRVVQIAQEPVAVALLYAALRSCGGTSSDPSIIMVCDLGRRTFDVAVLEMKDGVISTSLTSFRLEEKAQSNRGLLDFVGLQSYRLGGAANIAVKLDQGVGRRPFSWLVPLS